MARKRYHRKKTKSDVIIILALSAITFGLYIIYEILGLIDLFIANATIFHWIVLAIIIYLMLYLRKEKIKADTIKQKTERKRRTLRASTMQELREMNPFEFEHYVADLFRLNGYDATVTKQTGDGGKDIILTKEDLTTLVECKRYNKPKVTRPDIQKFHSALVDYNADGGFYITTSYFTKPAEDYAKGKNIHLINGESLLNIIEEITRLE